MTMATQNSVPKPFVSQYSNYGNNNTQQQVPKIMINNRQPFNNNGPSMGYHHQQHYGSQLDANPTSTVHKSMVHSRQFNGNQQQVQPAYSRLISPTISQGSMSPQSGATEFAQQRNQQEAGRVSWASTTPKEHHQVPQPVYSQQHYHHQTQPVLPEQHQQFMRQQQEQQQQQHRFEQGQHPVSSHIYGGEQAKSHESAAPMDQIVREPEVDYKELLARISPSSPRHPSNILLPDDRRDGFMRDKTLERMTIAHQTYRTTPIVLPKPKARHDLATGSYMHLNQDPTWDLLGRSSSHHDHQQQQDQHAIKIQQALKGCPNSADLINSLPRSAPSNSKNNNSNRPANMNNITGFVGTRTGAPAGSVQPTANSGFQQHAGPAANRRGLDSDPVPVFNYRDYIDSTRRAR